jgi:hypothetical protein
MKEGYTMGKITNALIPGLRNPPTVGTDTPELTDAQKMNRGPVNRSARSAKMLQAPTYNPQNIAGYKNPKKLQLNSPQFKEFYPGQNYYTPGQQFNIQRAVANQLNSEMDRRQQAGIGYLQSAQDNTRNIYNSSLGDVNQFGQQELGRIDQQEKERVAAEQSRLMNAGLGNSTVLGTAALGPQRNADDQRLGVAQQRAGLRMSIRDAMAANERSFGSGLSNYMLAREPINPAAQVVGNQPYGSGKSPWGQIAGSLLGQGVGAIVGGFTGGMGSQAGAMGANFMGNLFKPRMVDGPG